MLLTLKIRNFAVIEELELEFSDGLTAFTGETGAGKSILIEAFGFLLGDRGSVDWIRSGAKKLEVSGSFESSGLDPALRAEFGLGEKFWIRRELDEAGKSRAFLDSRPAKVADLARISRTLVDFHGQHEHQTLMRPETQLELLDAFGTGAGKRAAVAEAYAAWSAAKKKLESLQMSDDERLRRLDLYRFQLAEIEDADPKPGEEEALEAELPRLKNAEKLMTLASDAYGALYENDGSAEENLRKAEAALEQMAGIDPGLREALAGVSRAREAAGEASAHLARYREGIDGDPERIDDMIGRQDRLARLKKKYGPSLRDVIETRDKLRCEVASLENHGETALEAERAARSAEKTLQARCEDLHAARMRSAGKLSGRVLAELKDLGMGLARLSVSVEMEEGQYSPSGNDRVEFLLSPNPGEPLKPLRSIASGGELSRVMLALKTVLAAQDRVGLLVFDEVDTGVGAAVGRSVGAKLAAIGAVRRVFCVTHLPQVACCARTHFHVEKSVAKGRTYAKVVKLDGKRRLEAVARMLGGRKVTDASLRHARELMESA